MKNFKLFSVLFLLQQLLFLSAYSQDQNRKIINIPDIPGYKTLKCDLHMHTVFSDGTVWPTFRVEEAWVDGLDVIAITDHLGKHPKNKVNDDNFNKAYELAKPVADKLGIVLIKGSEITTKTNYGHMNAIFLKDINLIDKKEPLECVKAAAEQGAFITWNHPGWKKENDIPVWEKEQEDMVKQGLLNGIEVANHGWYYPLALTWSKEKNLTVMGNSDIHDPATSEFNYTKGKHRTMTLAFAKDTSPASIKEALLQHRTLAYYKDDLYGSEDLLKAVFKASVKVLNPEFSIDADSDNNYFNRIQIQNNSCINYELELADADKILKITKSVTLTANSVAVIDIKPAPRDIKGDKEYVLKFKVKNLQYQPDNSIIIEIPVKIKFI